MLRLVEAIVMNSQVVDLVLGRMVELRATLVPKNNCLIANTFAAIPHLLACDLTMMAMIPYPTLGIHKLAPITIF